MNSEWVMATEAICAGALFGALAILMSCGGCRKWLDALCFWVVILAAWLMLAIGWMSGL